MMEIINKIYNWLRKVILNIMGVIMDMSNKDNEVKILAMETVKDGIKSIFNSKNNRAILGMVGMFLSAGLLVSAYVELPEDKEVADNEN